MSDSDKKYPRTVRAIYIAGIGGEEGRRIDDDDDDSLESDRSPNVSRAYRDWDREVRAMSLAASVFFKAYLDHHNASNEETRDGALKHFGKNTVKAHKAAYKVLQNHSNVFNRDPTEVHDNIVEYLEDLEDEYDDED